MKSKRIRDYNYRVTDEGDIFRIPYTRIDVNGRVIEYNEKKRIPILSKGYLKIGLNVDLKRKCFFVHRLVAEAFIPNPDNKPEINHKDGNKKNNNVSNLEWVTHSENLQHAVTTGLIDTKLTSNDVVLIKKIWNIKEETTKEVSSKITKTSLGEMFGVSDTQICKIINGLSWR